MKATVIIAVISFNVVQGITSLGVGFMYGNGRYFSDSDPIARGGRGYDKFWVEYALEIPKRGMKVIQK